MQLGGLPGATRHEGSGGSFGFPVVGGHTSRLRIKVVLFLVFDLCAVRLENNIVVFYFGTSDSRYVFMTDLLFTLTKRVAGKTLIPGAVETALELAPRVMALAEDVINRFETQEPLGKSAACRPGCAYCCHYQVVMTPPEIFLVGTYVKNRFTAGKRQELFERIDRYASLREGKSLTETAGVLHETPCFFLENYTCVIYEVRPLVCRAWHAIDSTDCRIHLESATSRPEVEGYNHRHYVYKTVAAGMEAAIKEMGFQIGAFAIAGAMREYFRHHEPEKAWMRGDPVFSANLKE